MKKVEISYFSKVNDNVPKPSELHDWLESTIKPPKKLKEQVLKYRSTLDKKYKQNLPCVTISASFKGIRNLENIKKKNPYLVLDIDRASKTKNRPSNTCIDMSRVKAFLSKHPSTLYCGYSASEDGVYCILKVDKKVPLKKYFKYLKNKLSLNGIFIDESCMDITRLRFYSYDSEAFYNKNPVTLKLPKKEKIKKQKFQGDVSKDNLHKVESIIRSVEENSIDITSDYADWVKIAGCLYNAFGESGRPFFHRVSRFHNDYKEKATDRKFDSCRNMKRLTLSTFFYIADSYGIRY